MNSRFFLFAYAKKRRLIRRLSERAIERVSSCLIKGGGRRLWPVRSAPHCAHRLDDQLELGPLLVLGEDVALLGGGEAALGTQAELLEVGVLAGLVDAPRDGVPCLQNPALRGDEAEDDLLAALGQEAEGLEPSRAV